MTTATATFTLNGFFDAYQISYLEITDEPGNGTEIEAYAKDDRYIILPIDEDEDVREGYDWDTYWQLVSDYLLDIAGNYVTIEGTITRVDGKYCFKGNVKKALDV